MSYITSCVEVCKYLSITVGCRNTIENKVCSALLTTTSLSCCLWFNDVCSLSSSRYMWHTWAMFLSKNSFSLSAPAKTFVTVVLNLLFLFIHHRSVCKGKACFTLTTWPGRQWVQPVFWFQSRCVFLWTTMCQNWSLDDKIADRGR